jgi:hypothetical protein
MAKFMIAVAVLAAFSLMNPDLVFDVLGPQARMYGYKITAALDVTHYLSPRR